MGEQQVHTGRDPSELRRLALALLDDLDALERLIEQGRIESGVRRIGAEQELFLVDETWRPAPLAMEVLERLDGEQFTTELGRYNLEINLDPLSFKGRCLSEMLDALEHNLAAVRTAAGAVGADTALVGILPTLRKTDLGIENMTPRPRYYALNDAMNALRGGPWRLQVRGVEELASKHDNVMLESCCTSFQAHLQVSPEEFAPLYNLAQALTAPVLAVAANSPVLFGRRLWHETRIPLFQQSIDTRRTGDSLRQAAPRVRFGERWLDDSILELFREDVVRFRMLIGSDEIQDPFAAIAAGDAPRLSALCLHNGTVYRWNRGCYGVSGGIPHLRIEMRCLPSGPTPIDEVANAALYFGLVLGLAREYPDVRRVLRFDQAHGNFQSAARRGLDADMVWIGGERIPAGALVRRLLPVARSGLVDNGVDADDADRFLEVIDRRLASGQTGAQWLLGSYARLAGHASRHEITTALTAALVGKQQQGDPVHEWDWAELDGATGMSTKTLRVEDIMSTDLYTVGPDEAIDLVGKIMQWKGVRHVPVEDEASKLIGMLSCFHVLAYLGERQDRDATHPVSSLMATNPPYVAPDAPLGVALALMREQGVDSLPVVNGGYLVGIVSERDFIEVVARSLDG